MSHKSIQITFSESEVSTLFELANELKKMYKWESWCISENGTNIIFTAKDFKDDKVKKGYVGSSGFAYHLEENLDDQFNEDSDWDEYNVDWDEDFDEWSNHVWGTDEEGNTVMVHD